MEAIPILIVLIVALAAILGCVVPFVVEENHKLEVEEKKKVMKESFEDEENEEDD